MEVIYMCFKMISSLITDMLYEKSMVNNLFSFNLEKKIVFIKDMKKKTNNNSNQREQDLNEEMSPNDDVKIFNTLKIVPTISKKNTIISNNDIKIPSRNKVYNDEDILKSNYTNTRLNDETIKPKKLKKKKKKLKKSLVNNIINSQNK